MNATTTPSQGPAAQGFAELAALDQAEANLNKRLTALHSELAPVGWRGRPAVPAIPGLVNRDPGLAPSGRIGHLLGQIPKLQAAAAREGRDPTGIAKIEAELELLERRSEELRAEIRALRLELRRLPDQRRAVVRAHYPRFVLHAREVARAAAEQADQVLVTAARQVLADRAEVIGALRLAQTGQPTAGINGPESAEVANRLARTFAPWGSSNRPASNQLWQAIETVASASFARTEGERA